jgi:hypothetical protein
MLCLTSTRNAMRCNRRRFLKFDILDDQKTTDASSGAETSEEKLVAGVSGDVASGFFLKDEIKLLSRCHRVFIIFTGGKVYNDRKL